MSDKSGAGWTRVPADGAGVATEPPSREERLAQLRADRRPGPKLTAERPVPVGKAEALYAGSCRLCQRPIAEGDDIAFLDGRPVHGEHR